MDYKITVTAGTQTMQFQSLLLGGTSFENEHETVGFYGGPRNIGDFGVATAQALRAALQFARNEFGLNDRESIMLINECLEQAISLEKNQTGRTETYRQVYKG